VIYTLTAFQFGFFPATAFPIGAEELDRAVLLAETELSGVPTPFVTPEDILLAKLHWFQAGSGISEMQWRDIQGLVRSRRASLDQQYLEQGAQKLGVSELLQRAIR
jgi:hypothetical protein